MSNEGFQIEIPTFDDDDTSNMVPFGARGAFGQSSSLAPSSSLGAGGQSLGGFSFGGQSFGQSSFGQSFGSFGSPTNPLAQSEGLSRFGTHARGDSVTSDSSNRSFHFGGTHHEPSSSLGALANHIPHTTRKPSAAGATTHTSSSSLVAFPSRKSSFASLKNAFKSKASQEPTIPPVPAIDHQAYPALRNPFSRSASSLNNNGPQPLSSKDQKRKATTKSPSQSRVTPPPPNTAFSRVRAHSHAKSTSAHSHSSSIAQSEHSDQGPETSPSSYPTRAPPVPPVPDEYGANVRRHRALPSGISELYDPVVPKPQKPHEYALHVVFTKFVTCAEDLVTLYISSPLQSEASLTDLLGPDSAHTKDFNRLLESMAQLARKHAHPVIDSIMRWRRGHKEQPLDDALVEKQLMQSRDKFSRMADVTQEMVRRKELATIYVLCRALVIVLRSIPKEGLDETFGDQLESTFFEEFVTDPDMKLLSQSANHRANAELYTMVLGEMANTRFQSVTDRFLQVLSPLAAGQIFKDGGLKYENIIRGLEHIQLRVWPPEAFDEAAEFVESLSKSFANAHGQRLKVAFSIVLTKLLHPIGKTAMAEVNHPLWARGINTIFSKAKEMASKPRYWSAAYPLLITSLCLSPNDYFLRNWHTVFEHSLSKVKEKSQRTAALNAIVRLFWTYLYRCNEPSSTAMSKLDAVRPLLFPPKRRAANTSDEAADALVCTVHFILSRYFDYGKDLVLELLQESTVEGIPSNPSSSFIDTISPDRFTIGLRALVLAVHNLEKESSPPWPTNTNFSSLTFGDDYPSSAGALPEIVLSKPDVMDFLDRVGPIVAKLVSCCGHVVGHMSVVDARYRLQPNLSLEEREYLVIKYHNQDLAVSYPQIVKPHIELLAVCFDSWPRLLGSSNNLSESFDLLIRAVLHVDPQLGNAAENCLRRFIQDDSHVKLVLSRFTRFLFAPFNVLRDAPIGTSSPSGFAQHERLTSLWADLVESWSQRANDLDSGASEVWGKDSRDAAGVNGRPEGKLKTMVLKASSLIEDIEAGGLYLLISNVRTLRSEGIRVLRCIPTLAKNLNPTSEAAGDELSSPPTFERVIDILERKGLQDVAFPFQKLPVGDAELEHLKKLQEDSSQDLLIKIAESRNPLDQSLWRYILPMITRTCLQYTPSVFHICRDTISAAITRYHPLMSSLAEIQSKSTAAQIARSPPQLSRGPAPAPSKEDYLNEIEQWQSWVVVLCASAMSSESHVSPTRDHYRVPSDPTSQRERLSTARGLFRQLIPFLTAEDSKFRTGVVHAMGCIQQSAFRTLLEDLQSITRRLYDDVRNQGAQKGRRTRSSGELHTAVMQIYRLTAHFAKDSKSISDHAILSLMLQFIRETKTYLSDPDARLDLEGLKLRTYFCGVVEHLFDGISVLKDSERFMTPNTRLTLYRLCQEWCRLGAPISRQRKLDENLSPSTVPNHKQQDGKGGLDSQLKVEEEKLSDAAAGAMASLLTPTFFAPDSGVDAKGTDSEHLGIKPTLDWMRGVFNSGNPAIRGNVKKALRFLVTHPSCPSAFVDEVLRRGFPTTDFKRDGQEFYDVIVDIILEGKENPFSFSQAVCFALSNLSHPAIQTRGQAFDVLEEVVSREMETKILAPLEVSVRNPEASVYLDAQLKVSDLLAHAFSQHAHSVIAQCALQLPQPRCEHIHMLRAMAPWTGVITLIANDNTLPFEGHCTLINLFSLTVRFVNDRPEDTHAFWAKLAVNALPNNFTAIVKFLIERSIERGCTDFLSYARRIIAGLSCTEVGPLVYEELCSVIDTLATGATPEFFRTSAAISKDLFTANLDVLIPQKSRLNLGTGQVALVLLSHVTVDRAWDFRAQLPLLLQACLTQVDQPQAFVRKTVRSFLFGTLRSWIPGYDEIPPSMGMPPRSSLKAKISELEDRQEELFWAPAEDPKHASDNFQQLHRLCAEVLAILEPLFPQLRQTWGELALEWGTTCPIPATARRSIQVLRALTPGVNHNMIASMLHRLSNTISDTNRHFQSFAREIIMTLTSVVRLADIDRDLVPPLFWSASACLFTNVESEFLLAVEFFDSLLDHLDFDEEVSRESIEAAKPADWKGGDGALHRLVIAGMRSSVTAPPSLKALMRIAEIPHTDALDPSHSTLRRLFAVSIPWCLEAMEAKSIEPQLAQFALDISAIAREEQKTGISRIMESFAKSRFRTKDDFLRQAVGCLREYFMAEHSTEVVTILLGLVLNSEKWLRIRSMQVLKLLFGHAETRNPLILHGSDLLMPLLRLVTTDLAQQALEVLDEPLAVTGGPAASHVLRMSMHALSSKTAESAGEIFSSPAETGWCIAKPEDLAEACRHNVLAVCSSLQDAAASHPVSIIFVNDDMSKEHVADFENKAPSLPTQSLLPEVASVGELVNTLHDLGEFFQSSRQPSASNVEERVAMILSRSLAVSGERDDPLQPKSASSSIEWEDGSFPNPLAPPTPGPFSGLFSSPQHSPGSLHRNFDMESDDEDDDQTYGSIRKSSSPRPFVEDDNDESDDEMDAFALEDFTQTPARDKGFRQLLSSRLAPRAYRNRH